MNAPLTYQQWLTHIEACHPQEMELGLARVSEVGKRAGVLHFTVPVVTVAGTNGKGSTVATLAKLLLSAGLKVGTYTSPHLFDFKERIQINGQWVSEGAYCEAFEKIEASREQITLTFFEFTTLAAFTLFQQEIYQLDIVILEVGLGGRLDAVNMINPDLAIVTSIGLDHQSYLGETLESIANEKAGIFRYQKPAVISKTAKISSLLAKAATLDMKLMIEGEDFEYDEIAMSWRVGCETNIKIKHYLPLNSVSLAMAAYTILDKHHFSLPALSQIVKSLENNVMMGRCYPVVLNKCQVIFDVGHNPQGGQWLADCINKMAFKKKRVSAVWASMADKDLAGIVKPMKDIVDSWYIGEVQTIARSATSNELQHALEKQGINDIHVFDHIVQAFDAALMQSCENDLIVVFGSFYTVSHIMQNNIANIKYNNNGLSEFRADFPRTNVSVISEY